MSRRAIPLDHGVFAVPEPTSCIAREAIRARRGQVMTQRITVHRADCGTHRAIAADRDSVGGRLRPATDSKSVANPHHSKLREP